MDAGGYRRSCSAMLHARPPRGRAVRRARSCANSGRTRGVASQLKVALSDGSGGPDVAIAALDLRSCRVAATEYPRQRAGHPPPSRRVGDRARPTPSVPGSPICWTSHVRRVQRGGRELSGDEVGRADAIDARDDAIARVDIIAGVCAACARQQSGQQGDAAKISKHGNRPVPTTSSGLRFGAEVPLRSATGSIMDFVPARAR